MNKKLLIIDDDKDIRDILRINLENSKITVLEAATSKEALDKCKNEKPDLILLDFRLADEIGFDISDSIASNEKLYGKPKIIGMSAFLGGHPEKSPIFKSEKSINYFINKPFNMDELVTIVKEMIN